MSATSFESPQLMPDPLPLRIDDQGAIRVGNSRITLDILVEDFERGSTPEDIVANYETLQRGDVYAVLGYYLNHRGEVEEYLRRRELEAAQIENGLQQAGLTWPEAGKTLRARSQDGTDAPISQ